MLDPPKMGNLVTLLTFNKAFNSWKSLVTELRNPKQSGQNILKAPPWTRKITRTRPNIGKFYATVHCQTSFCEFVKELGWGGCYANTRLRTRTNSYITHNMYIYIYAHTDAVSFPDPKQWHSRRKGWIITNTSSFPSHYSLACHKINME